MKNWRSKHTITKNIDGHDVVFQRISAGTLQKFRILNDDVSKALAILMLDTSKDAEVTQLSVPSEKQYPDGTPIMTQDYKQAAVSPALASMRKAQLDDGIKHLLDLVTSEQALDVLCEIIVKSAPAEFDTEDIQDIKEHMDILTMFEFLKGAFEASAGDYEKLGKSLCQKSPAIQKMAEMFKQTI